MILQAQALHYFLRARARARGVALGRSFLRRVRCKLLARAAHAEFDTFRDSVWGMKHPHAVATWQAAWERIIPHLAFPRGLRRGLDSRRLGSTLPPLRVGRRRAHVPDETQTERTLQRAPAPMPSARLRPAVTTAVVADQAAGMNAPGGVRAGGSPRP